MEIAVQQSYGKKYDIIFDTTCLYFVLTFLLKEVAFFQTTVYSRLLFGIK